jgi:hypothetical protein
MGRRLGDRALDTTRRIGELIGRGRVGSISRKSGAREGGRLFLISRMIFYRTVRKESGSALDPFPIWIIKKSP